MNISTADFDWISLLFVIGAAIVGLIKNASPKKKEQPPVSQPPDFADNKKEVEEVTIPEFQMKEYYEEEKQEEITPGDYYRDPKISPQQATETRQEEEEAIYFDIRQAIISSEILKRPEF